MGVRQITICTNKDKYPSRRAAKAVGKKTGQRAYCCGVCGWCHLTSLVVTKPPKRQKRRAG